jgi:dipeptidyl aminopeptidase/acylaminoacyl peptidase
VHGTADDNVWFLNGLKLADALERGGRPFGFLPLAGVTHMPLDPDLNEALWLRTARVLRDALGPPAIDAKRESADVLSERRPVRDAQ